MVVRLTWPFCVDIDSEDGTTKRSLPPSSPEGWGNADNTCRRSSQGGGRECQNAVEGVIPSWVGSIE